MINQRLFDWYGIDTNKDLQINTRCPRPFDTVLIDKQGSCYLCECTAWLPQSAGNLYVQSLETILNSNTAKILRNSIEDGSYRYCNDQQCSYLISEKRAVEHENQRSNWTNSVTKVQIKNIRLAIDDSCNLQCPSCRTKLIFEKDKVKLKKKFKLADKIIEYVKQQSHTINLHLGSDGDPFASLIYRYFAQQTEVLSNVKFSIQTNGLLVKKMYKRFQKIFKNLDVLNISIDGASKATYEKLRKGGSFEKILENLNFLKSIEKKFKVNLHMVVQQENWQEMPAMIKLAEEFNVDRVFFNKIQNWNTGIDFSKQTFANNKEFKKVFEEIKTNPLSSFLQLL